MAMARLTLAVLVLAVWIAINIDAFSVPVILAPQFSLSNARKDSTTLFQSTKSAGSSKRKSLNRNSRKKTTSKKKVKRIKDTTDPSTIETWRLYGITTHPDEDDWYEQIQQRSEDERKSKSNSNTQTSHDIKNVQTFAPIPHALEKKLLKRLKLRDKAGQEEPKDADDDETNDSSATSPAISTEHNIQVVRRSVDARKKLDHPQFSYVVDVTLTHGQARKAGLSQQSGRTEKLSSEPRQQADSMGNVSEGEKVPKKVVVVGAGPAGLFCALQLVLSKEPVEVVLLDRGQPVELRGRDIGALIHRRELNEDSNFAFGEGGAGTWSDGKLTTRIGRNSDNVRWSVETLVQYGAPANILWEGAPHLGTDNLVRLLRNLREALIHDYGVQVQFGAKVTDLVMDPEDPTTIQGVQVAYSPVSKNRTLIEQTPTSSKTSEETLYADAVVLATGHSARDVYERLAEATNGGCLEPKGFAVGFRIEHPQTLITDIQYGSEWGPTVTTGTGRTDQANKEYFEQQHKQVEESKQEDFDSHTGRLPVPSYRLATDEAKDGTPSESGLHTRGVYSFCMCPGGQIVPSSTNSSEVCVNGMSFSRRNSEWANSALVVTIAKDDPILDPYKAEHGVLAGVAFQRDMEHRAAMMGGGTNLTVPVQRVTDFLTGQISESLPSSSYRLGVKSAPCHELYPEPITTALRDALVNHFNQSMPGYVHPDGLLHAVETRTSSPLQMARNRTTCIARGMSNLFPAGEGAGFAGGIVSAAVDGRIVAEGVLDSLYGLERGNRQADQAGSSKSIGFSY